MAFPRTFVVTSILASLVATAILASLFVTSCGDTDEQKELEAYSVWLDERDERQTEILEPLELSRGVLQAFANGLAPLIESGDHAKIQKDAEAARSALAGVRDDVKPDFDAFGKRIEARGIESIGIKEVHARFLRSIELRMRGIDALAAVADRVDELIAAGTVKEDPARDADLEKLKPLIQAGVNDADLGIFGSEKPLREVWKETKDALAGLGAQGSDLFRKGDRALGAQGTVIRNLEERLRKVQGIEGLAPVLLTVERVLIPEFSRALESTAKIEMPEGAAREAWARIQKILKGRLTALENFGALSKNVDRYCDLMAGMPEARIIDVARRSLRMLSQAAEDLAQAAESYRRFTDEVRKLRRSIL